MNSQANTKMAKVVENKDGENKSDNQGKSNEEKSDKQEISSPSKK